MALLLITALSSCEPINVYEKSVPIPNQEWSSSFKPSFRFSITDTTALYDVELVLRHTNAYETNNIWLNISLKTPTDSFPPFRVEKTLASNTDGWLGTGMDDIFEQRLSLNDELARESISFRTPGEYSFTLEQIMREDPLPNVLNVGIRVEKKQK